MSDVRVVWPEQNFDSGHFPVGRKLRYRTAPQSPRFAHAPNLTTASTSEFWVRC